MGLVRRGGKAYYYQSVRVEGRVTSRYLASGEPALILAGLDAVSAVEERRERGRVRRHEARLSAIDRARRDGERAEGERFRAEDRQFGEYFDRVESIARATLRAAGFEQHARGIWRRRMAGRVETTGDEGGSLGAEADDFLRRAAAGDRSTLAALRELLDGAERAGIAPALIEAFRGDPATIAEDRLIVTHAGENLVAAEALRRRLAQVRAEIAGTDPSPIERLLAERAALCWLAVNRLEALAALADPTTRRTGLLHKRLDGAHRRFLTSLKTLATVRRLVLPVLQREVAPSRARAARIGPVGIPKAAASEC